MKLVLHAKKKSFDAAVKEYDSEKTGAISQRNLKVFLHITFLFNAYEIENLIMYLDRDRDGYVLLHDIETGMKMA